MATSTSSYSTTTTSTTRPSHSFPGSVPTLTPQTPSTSSTKKALWVIPVIVCLSVFVALGAVLLVLWKKKKLDKLNPYQNPYFRKLKRDAQMERVGRVEAERRAAAAAVGKGTGEQVTMADLGGGQRGVGQAGG